MKLVDSLKEDTPKLSLPPSTSYYIQVAATIYWLGVLVKDLPDYTGPLLNLDLSVVGELESSSPDTVRWLTFAFVTELIPRRESCH